MKNKAIIALFLLALFISICSSIFAQEDAVKNEKQIIHNNVYFTTGETGPHSLTLNITKLKSDEGAVMLSFVDENDQQLDGVKIPIVDGKCSVIIDSLQTGKYAVRYYHDINNNGELDTGAFGIPKEGYGFSNNARGFMGPPDFEDMIFKLEDDLTLEMKTVN